MNTEANSEVENETTEPETPDDFKNLTRQEIINLFLKKQTKIKELEQQMSSAPPRARQPREKSADQVKRDELEKLWQAIEPNADDESELIKEIKSKDRLDQLAAIPKLVRMLPWNKVHTMILSLGMDVEAQRTVFNKEHGYDFHKPMGYEAIIRGALKKQEKKQPKRKQADPAEKTDAQQTESNNKD